MSEMLCITSKTRMQFHAESVRASGRRVALVPTMGALHEGHMALVEAARAAAQHVVLSIYVNPSQFDQARDLARYPRDLEADLERCRAAGVDVVFAPGDQDMYPAGADTWVEVPGLSGLQEGASRPGHFRGVATVVTKLLLITRPHLACFGEKDYQQLVLVRRLTEGLGMDVDVVGVPTVREEDGLALSSRNRLLTKESRVQARALSRALSAAETLRRDGERRSAVLLECARGVLQRAADAKIDYVELCDPETLAPAPELAGPALRPEGAGPADASGRAAAGRVLLTLAVEFPALGGGVVRLLDNRLL